jgi:hypothetical protein
MTKANYGLANIVSLCEGTGEMQNELNVAR